uniref:Endoplasmic reticulum lectin n=1 Tax=Cairina moschata TaxID=8855 RepID=A0A8C3BNM6_CAIMO
RYECRLPPAALRPPPAPPEEAQLYNGSGVAELLRPMGAAPCLVKTKDWWTYEFCYGKHIQQYHIEESEIKGDVLFLGHYQSAFNWDDETAKASKQHRLKRYHSQSYVNGSRCDLTGRPREAEVRFLCEEGAGDYLARVDEPQSCSYVLTVHTPRLCRHPHLRPPPGAAPQPILCQPALSPAQYVQYVRAQVSDTKRKVEEISEELKTLDTRLWSERDAQPPPQPPQEARGDAQPGAEQDPKEAAFWERVREVTGQQRGEEEEEEEEEEEGELLGGVLLPPERVARLKEEVKTEMEKEFDNIINEVEEELEPEGLKGEFDRQRASKALASTLTRLMDKLDAAPPAPPAQKQEEEEEEESARRKAGAPPPAEQAPGKIEIKIVTAG